MVENRTYRSVKLTRFSGNIQSVICKELCVLNCVPVMYLYSLYNHLFQKVVNLAVIPNHDTVTCYQLTCLLVECSKKVFYCCWHQSQYKCIFSKIIDSEKKRLNILSLCCFQVCILCVRKD